MKSGRAESPDIWESVARKELPNLLDVARTLETAGFDFRAHPVIDRRLLRW